MTPEPKAVIERTTGRGWLILFLVMCMVGSGHFNRVSMSVAGSEAIIDKDADAETTSEAESEAISEPASETESSHDAASGSMSDGRRPATSPRVSTTKMGSVYTSFLIFYTAFMIPGGWLIDRIGPKWSLMIMCVGSALFSILTGLTGLVVHDALSLWLGLLVVRSLMGITNSPLHPAGARMVAAWMPPSVASFGNGMVTFAACLGMALVYVTFGKLIDWFSWQIAFIICGCITLVLATVWMLLASDGPRWVSSKHIGISGDAGPQHNVWTLLADPNLITLTVSYAAVGYFQYLFFYWMEFYFEHVLKLDRESSRWLSTSMVLSMGAGMAIGGTLADLSRARGGRHAHRLVPMACLGLGAIFVAIAVMASSQQTQISLLLLSMGAVGATEGSYWTYAIVLGKNRGGTAGAIMNAGGNLGALLAPIITPIVALYLDWDSVMYLASGMCIVGAVTWLGVHIRNEDRQV